MAQSGQTIARRRYPRFKGYWFRPLFRGWIHLITTPLALAATIVLVCLSPSGAPKWASLVFLSCSLILFGVSAFYHRFEWGPRWFGLMRKWDHSNVFLLIAGSYTPLIVTLLSPADARTLGLIVWGGACAGILMYWFWPTAPRTLHVGIYILLGWAALWYLQPLYQAGGAVLIWLLVAGGIAYSIGALMYAFKWPGRNAKYFGFHELFHLMTVAGWTCICIAAYFAVLNAG